MESSEDKQWVRIFTSDLPPFHILDANATDAHHHPQATRYLLDPLNAPEPSQETGPGTHYNSTFSSNPNRQSTSTTSSAHKKTPSVSVRETNATTRNGLPSPPSSTSPHKDRFPKPAASEPSTHNRRSSDRASTQVPTSTGGDTSSTAPSTRPRRTSSLSARYQGDRSHRPLEMIARDQKLAHRSHHLRKNQHIGADSIDQLDIAGGTYHHEGPFDAASMARNIDVKHAPLEAIAATNAEALKATPEEKIIDSVRKHRPLDGVAAVPPGQADRDGRVYTYEEGTDLMIEDGGNYKRWPGVVSSFTPSSKSVHTHPSASHIPYLTFEKQKYLPTDLKGKGEPSYSIEKALKEHKHGAQQHRRVMSEGQPAYEMVPTSASASQRRRRPELQARSSSYGDGNTSTGMREQRYADWERERPRSSEGGAKGLKKRIGSLRRRE
ncbi:MAG: hypothetical protein Q9222_003239 [Ikaeria aurantiellina]